MPTWDVTFDLRVGVRRPEIASLVPEIHALARVIKGIPLPPSTQLEIDRLNIMRAVRGTTGIEGVELTEEQVRDILKNPGAARRREEKEVVNANKVMRYVVRALTAQPRQPLTEAIICKMHELITEGIDYRYNEPGVYRNHAVQAGNYEPPRTGDEVRDLMSRFIEWFNQGEPASWDPVIRAIVGHFYVVSIHPFAEGNGRTARAVEAFLLYQGGVNVRGFYSLANYYYLNRSDYIFYLDYVRFQSNGDLTPFLLFGLTGLVRELESVHARVLDSVKLTSFRDLAREALAEDLATKRGTRMLNLILELCEGPIPLAPLRRGKHPLSALYSGLSAKTLVRDINYLRTRELVVIENGELRANLAIMTRFIPPEI